MPLEKGTISMCSSSHSPDRISVTFDDDHVVTNAGLIQPATLADHLGPVAYVRQYAASQRIGVDVADQEIVLHYALELLNQSGLIGTRPPNTTPGPLLFKGGTALRKCVFGQSGRFSQDVDLDARYKNGFEAEIESAFAVHSPFYGITFSIPNFRYSQDDNFSGGVTYSHENGTGDFELQISYRLTPILDPVDLVLQEQTYFARVEFPPPRLHGLDP